MIFAMLATFHIFAANVLDTEMSQEDKKNTGINKLSSSEKAALQQWIDANYQKKSSDSLSGSQQIKGLYPTLSENLMKSQYLRLSDGTLWNVRPEDVPIAQAWITPVEIVVSQSSNPFFPYKLTNQVSGTSILARKADKLPQQSAPSLSPTDE
jgi:hypothetical protein